MNIQITSAQVRDSVLDPAMDAIALGEERARLIHHPDTPEADSLMELLSAMGTVVVRLAKANGLGMEAERVIAGWADEMVTHLRDGELNGADPAPSGRRLADLMKAPLDVLCDPQAQRQFAPARDDLTDIFGSVPRSAIFRDAVIYHLRPRRARALRAAYEYWERQQAARDQRTIGHRESRA